MDDNRNERDLLIAKRFRARAKYRYALRKGTLIRGNCAKCGSLENIHGHHEDLINNPLEVVWLCSTCHNTVPKKDGNRLSKSGSKLIHVRLPLRFREALGKLVDGEHSLSSVIRSALERYLVVMKALK